MTLFEEARQQLREEVQRFFSIAPPFKPLPAHADTAKAANPNPALLTGSNSAGFCRAGALISQRLAALRRTAVAEYSAPSSPPPCDPPLPLFFRPRFPSLVPV
ncbi:unnamed protein product [Phytomonas sp. Hart1]|nr:unnamed protein product [Phytomonas sp. Hart1]|eukprot:CCW66681.1 unnamed protein product [Phytomonas sp. isolate Hart1]